MAIVDWINPATCFDEIMLVAAAGAPNTGTPAGDGSAYTPSLVFGTGTALGNGFVLYKGLAGPQTVTALTNGSTYYFKLFTRMGSSWSMGTEITAIPVPISAVSDHFRSAVVNGNWDQPASWESSPNGITNWIPATLAPHSGAGIITIRSGDTIHIINSLTIDQVVVEPGSSLVLSAGIVLADGTGAADLEVNGSLINSAGTHSYSGTVVFHAGSIYQHNRNAGTVPPASWHSSSNCVFTGITSTAPGGLAQLFGNVQWDCA
ncbi:MAG TPA: hypothetical protein VFY78_02285, partial [Gammaproteobacteria bacterium]|nr:hypothetical protein [Gammaproteobacteria bacterium]